MAGVGRILRGIVIAAVVALVAIQLVPYGRDHTNPPVRQEPRWDSATTRELTRRACFDCHSNETHWPWYTHVAPISWLTQYDVVEGWRAVNYSEWDRPQEEARESAETVREGEMPPWFYLVPRPHARLSAAERATLIRGLDILLAHPKRPSYLTWPAAFNPPTRATLRGPMRYVVPPTYS